MLLRCLLFASDQATSEPLWRIITDLGMEGERCQQAVQAVEMLNHHPFHIVIADWDDEPEASFLLKTARELKAAQRPLTLAIIRDEAMVPKALQAGANSVLRKPITSNQVKDTLGTARDLLRAKLEPAVARPRITSTAGAAAAPAPAPERIFRAGEFLQAAPAKPGAQFDTEPEPHSSLAPSSETAPDTLNELEPVAGSVEAGSSPNALPLQPQPTSAAYSAPGARSRTLPPVPVPANAPAPQLEPRAELKSAVRAEPKSQLLSYDETQSGTPAPDGEASSGPQPDMQAEPVEEEKLQPAAEFQSPDEAEEPGKPAAAKSGFRFRKPLLAAALVLTCTVAYVEVPRTMWRHNLQLVATFVARSTHNLLNPQPPVPVQVPTAHESFGQAGDEYKLPAVENIPDATTDPSQISVVPVIDPTAKPPNSASQNNAPSDPTTAAPIDPAQPAQTPPSQTQPAQAQPAQVKAEENPGAAQSVPVAQQPLSSHPNTPESASPAASQPPRSNTADIQAPSAPTAPPVRTSPTHVVPSGPAAAIPGSLRSQLASSTPEASGTKPLEAALPSIGPIDVPEASARALLTQQVEPVYPELARASAQHGTVVLQVMIGRDGAVQDAKFLQGSLVFARSAIDAVKQWRFTPYSFNGRPAPVRTTLTLIFKPSS